MADSGEIRIPQGGERGKKLKGKRHFKVKKRKQNQLLQREGGSFGGGNGGYVRLEIFAGNERNGVEFGVKKGARDRRVKWERVEFFFFFKKEILLQITTNWGRWSYIYITLGT